MIRDAELIPAPGDPFGTRLPSPLPRLCGCVGTTELRSRFATDICSLAIPFRLRSHPTGSPSAESVSNSRPRASIRVRIFKTGQTRPPGRSGRVSAETPRNEPDTLAHHTETNDKEDLYTPLFTCRF